MYGIGVLNLSRLFRAFGGDPVIDLQTGAAQAPSLTRQTGMPDFEVIYDMPFKKLGALVEAEVADAYPNGAEIDWEVFKKGCK